MLREPMFTGVVETLRQRMNRCYDTETIRLLARLFGPAVSTRKEDRLNLILRHLEGDGLKRALDQLDETSRKAVAEAAYDPRGRYDPARFQAKYGALPEPWQVSGRASNPFFGLFIIEGMMPEDLGARVRALLPRPPEMKPRSVRTLPEKAGGKSFVTIRTEEAALHDVLIMLYLIAGGAATMTPQRQNISTRAVRAIAGRLYPGDGSVEAGAAERNALRAKIWVIIVQVARLAREGEKQLLLTREGQDALTSPPHETMRTVWERWVSTARHNEIEQYNEEYMAYMEGLDLERLRKAVIDSLARFPVGEWIETDHLVNFLKTTEDVFRPNWRPSFAYRYYYSDPGLGRDWESFIDTIATAYVLTFLQAYMATMGMVDLAYASERKTETARGASFTVLTLKYVRVTPLGAYCLGITDRYAAAEHEPGSALKVLPTLEVVMPDRLKTVRWEAFFLDQIAERTAEHVWKLDRKKILAAMERELPLDRIRGVLAPGGTALPDTVARFLDDIRSRETALRFTGEALLFEARDEAAADLFVHERRLQGLCRRAGEKTIVVPAEMSGEFLKTLKKMGYLVRMPKEKEV